MDNVRQRKVPTENGKSSSKTRGKKSPGGANKTRFYILTAIIGLTILFGVFTGLVPLDKYCQHGSSAWDRVSLSLGWSQLVHSAVIDAGSTGSRILAYTFIQGSDKSLKLYDELFVELKPGLSAFARNPKESRKNIEELLRRAKAVIPESARAQTPIVMKATAGLRLLHNEAADALLTEARQVLAQSGFLVDQDAVSIMDGVDEGLFSWFTVNFLLDRLKGNVGTTVAALDLGGGSTQIAFAPADPKTLGPNDQKFIHRMSAFDRTLSVYTHSYLGLGLNEARKRILQFNNTEHSFVLKSECINPIVKDHKWSYGGIGYLINGPENPEYETVVEDGDKLQNPVVRFDRCEKVVQSVLGTVDKPAELSTRTIHAFSYYYDRAADGGLIDFDKGGVVTVNDFVSAAKAKCKEANTDQAFLCLDLTFISVLLRDGFGLSVSNPINLVKRIDDHEISWALGAAFHRLQNS